MAQQHDDEEVARFDLDMDGSMEPSEDGRWVRYDDMEAAIERAVEAAILRLRG